MEEPVRIGVDLSGADVDQKMLFAACLQAASEQSVLLRCYHSEPLGHVDSLVESQRCPDVISMEDEALFAIRKKQNSSLVTAIKDLKVGRIAALVTCANTGAVTAASVVYLKRFLHLHHPALVVVLPLPLGPVVALDMGAFVHATKQDLVTYASLGSAYAMTMCDIPSPRIGLLNIGRESCRGTVELRRADEALSASFPGGGIYVGNVEPADVISGKVDVLVTSGFVGNIFLKTAEAVVGLSSSASYKPSGALLAGVNGVVIKCHGSGSSEALKAAIFQAQQFIHRGAVQSLASAFIHK